MQPDPKFMSWFDSVATGPGTMLLSYTVDGLTPFDYSFTPTSGNMPPTCGFRIFLHDDDGEVTDVEYFTIYPRVVSVHADGRLSEATGPEADAEVASAPPEYWKTGWKGCLVENALVISGMQSKLAMKMADEVGFDLEEFGSLVEAVYPKSDVVVGMSLARLRAEILRHKIDECTNDEAKQNFALAALELIDSLGRLALQALATPNQPQVEPDEKDEGQS
jgi:hypothetical protein